LDLGELMGRFVRDSAVLAQGTYCILVMVEESTGDLLLKTSYDRSKGTIAHHNRKVDEIFLSRVVATGEPLTLKLPERPYRVIFGVDAGPDGPVSVLSAPMRLRERITGVILVIRYPSMKDFQPAEINLLMELAGQASMAFEQASLFAKVRTYASELETSYHTTLKALMAALDTKDSGTEGHSERVSRLTAKVAREMGFAGQELVDIERGALLHDVGKIGVPDSILRKPGPLTKPEWAAMQQHPVLAGLMVSKVGFLEGTMPILLYHHERFDGGGYPYGLTGDQIPLEARIFAVVDTYDAITSDRPYRKASPPRHAVKEIRANSGTQFDPAVVEIFVTVMERLLAEEEARTTREAA
jgi:response regulator RpfG family c-di-GMP phosphodiesterase